MRKNDVFHCYDKRLVSNTEYVVKKGDTLYKIAEKYGVSVEDLISANNLENNMIYPNQIIVIPKQVPSGSVYFEEYVIQYNDTIQTIADKLGVSPEAIMKYNDITKLMLAENQVLKIPKSFTTYIVLPEDTLQTILEKTNMTLEELFNANAALWLAPGSTIFVK